MKINRLKIDDFGIIRNQILEDLSPGMVVIGGPNRAGKTTFLKLLRCLGYGFKGQQNIPPPTSKYKVEGDFALETGDLFHLSVEGHGEPRVSCIKGDKNKVETSMCLYNHLDSFTYQQLFTISLEELRRLPESIDDKEGEKLQSVLLGAGLKDIIQIAPVEKELRKEAEKIGGKKGDLNVKQFKPYSNEIIQGLEMRDKAKSQVSYYHEKQKEKNDIIDEINEIEKNLKDIASQTVRLDLLKNWHESYQRINELSQYLNKEESRKILETKPPVNLERLDQLIEDYENTLQDYNEQFEIFKSKLEPEENLSESTVLHAKEVLINRYNDIELYARQASGLKEKLNSYRYEKEELEDTRKSLLNEAKKIKKGFGESLEQIREIKTDHLSQSTLSEYIEDYHETAREKKEAGEEKERLQNELDYLNSLLEELETPTGQTLLKKYFIYALGFVAGGGIIGLINLLLGVLLGTAGMIGLGLYTLIKYQNSNQERMRQKDLENQIKRTIKLHQNEKEKEKQAAEKLAKISEKLNEYKSQLNLDEDVTPATIKEQFQKIVSLQEKIENLEARENKLNEKKNELIKELESLQKLINDINEEIARKNLEEKVAFDELSLKVDTLFIKLDKIRELAEKAKDLNIREQGKKTRENKIKEEIYDNSHLESEFSLQDLKSLRHKIQEYEKYKKMKEELDELTRQLLSSLKMDRVKEAFGIEHKEQDNELIDKFDFYWRQFASASEVKKAYQETEKKETELKEELDELKNKKHRLDLELKDLATDDNLQNAQVKIDEGRKKIKPLAEKYAIQKGAAYLLKEAKTMFLKQAKDSLLKEANHYLHQITGGEYKGIMPSEDLMNADFQIEKEDGYTVKTTEVLSRGTKEQLYLAVRLSRIKEITPPLPVILDDTLANFDMGHLDRTISLLSKLSNTHQVFVLTCHPELIEAITDYCTKPQFFKLNQGNFSQVDNTEILEFLSR